MKGNKHPRNELTINPSNNLSIHDVIAHLDPSRRQFLKQSISAAALASVAGGMGMSAFKREASAAPIAAANGFAGIGFESIPASLAPVVNEVRVPAGASPHTPWLIAGGDFAASPSALAAVGGVGNYEIVSTPGMIADVQHWIDTPAEVFGWILIGPEGNDISQRARRLYSRSSAAVDARPRLTISYTPSTPTARIVPVPAWAIALAGLVLAGVGLRGVSRRTF